MEFLLLNTKLQNCYGLTGAESDLQIYSPVLCQACVALYENKDWCRAQVTGVCVHACMHVCLSVRYVWIGESVCVCAHASIQHVLFLLI